MNTLEVLDGLQKAAINNPKLRDKLLETSKMTYPLAVFCDIARENGFQLYEMDLLQAGEEFYASMRRSTNGGGENSPKLSWEDDFYELFLASIRE